MDTFQKNSFQGKVSWSFKIKKTFASLLHAVVMAFCFAVYLGILPIFFIFMTPLYIYRFVVMAAQKVLKPDWVGMMSTRDAVVGLDNTSNHCQCMITILLTVKGESNLEQIRNVFRTAALEGKNSKGELSYLKLTYYFEKWMGFTFWKKEKNFSLEKHVREYDITIESDDPNNNSDVVTEDQLMKGLGSISTKSFPKGMSPWEVLVVKKYKKSPSNLHTDFERAIPVIAVDKDSERNAEFAVILRIHHAIGDGYSIMKLLITNICGSSSVVPRAPARNVSSFKKLGDCIAIIFCTPYYHFRQFFLNVDRTIWHLPSYKLTKQWQFSMTERISFEDLKSTSKRMGVCVTATLIAGLAGGIHSFLKMKQKGSRNTRVMRGLSPMPWTNHPMETLVNHWTVGIFDIPVNQSCRRKRLFTAYKDVKSLKNSPILVTNFITVPILLGAPNWLTNFWGTNWMTTMIISNFPGPDSPGVKFNGQCIDDVVSWVPHMRGSAGLGVMFLSYNGSLRVSLSVDKAIIKDQKELSELSNLIAQEYLALLSLQPETVV